MLCISAFKYLIIFSCFLNAHIYIPTSNILFIGICWFSLKENTLSWKILDHSSFGFLVWITITFTFISLYSKNSGKRVFFSHAYKEHCISPRKVLHFHILYTMYFPSLVSQRRTYKCTLFSNGHTVYGGESNVQLV